MKCGLGTRPCATSTGRGPKGGLCLCSHAYLKACTTPHTDAATHNKYPTLGFARVAPLGCPPKPRTSLIIRGEREMAWSATRLG